MRLYDANTGLPLPTNTGREEDKLIEAVGEWAVWEMERRGRVRPVVIHTAAGSVEVCAYQERRGLRHEDLAYILASPPTPHDDLLTGIRTLNNAFWTRHLSAEVRDQIRNWIQQANKLLMFRTK